MHACMNPNNIYQLKMGCNSSRLDSQGLALPARLRPLLLQRFQGIKARRNSGIPLKDPTHSKKVVLLPHDIDHKNVSQQLLLSPNPSQKNTYSPEPSPKGKEEAIGIVKTFECRRDLKDGRWKGRGKNEKKDGSKTHEDAFTDADEDELEVNDDDDDDHERMIGYESDDAFPGSPSFRVYFNENEVDGLDAVIGNKDGVDEPGSRDGSIPSKESSMEKKGKRNKKKKSFRKVLLPKNLLFVKSCYTSSHSSHDNSHLLPAGKTTT